METFLSTWGEKEEKEKKKRKKEKKTVPPDSKVLNRKTSVNLTEYARQSWCIANLSDDYHARIRKRKGEDENGKKLLTLSWRRGNSSNEKILQRSLWASPALPNFVLLCKLSW